MTASAYQTRQFPPADFDAALGHEAQHLAHGLRQTIERHHDRPRRDALPRSIDPNVIAVNVESGAGRADQLDVVDPGHELIFQKTDVDQRYFSTAHHYPQAPCSGGKSYCSASDRRHIYSGAGSQNRCGCSSTVHGWAEGIGFRGTLVECALPALSHQPNAAPISAAANTSAQPVSITKPDFSNRITASPLTVRLYHAKRLADGPTHHVEAVRPRQRDGRGGPSRLEMRLLNSVRAHPSCKT